MNEEIRTREMDIQRQLDDARIRDAKYKKKYKEISAGVLKPIYLREEFIGKENEGDRIRGLIKVRCGNMEEGNKYWMKEDKKVCWFCETGTDSLDHYVGDCIVTKGWFDTLGKNNRKRLDKIWGEKLNITKGKILIKLWREKEKKKEERRKTKVQERMK